MQKHVTARKGKNPAIHENSRDSKRLRTASARDDKLHKLASVRAKLNQPHRSFHPLLMLRGMTC